jgi:amidohydrolase
MSTYLSEALDLFKYTQSMRRDFHAHPELGFNEVRTARIITEEMTKLGLEVHSGVGGTGVVVMLEGTKPGPVLLIRADMDALPICEETGASYASLNPGVMHACGHDANTAILLTIIKLLNTHRSELSGTVKFLFQPAEETCKGAEKMIDEGVLQNPKVDLTLALHVWNEKPVGWIGIPNGPAMAGAEIFTIKIIGKGGHGGVPHLAVDPILAAAQVISALQGVVAHNISPLKAAVVSICTIRGGETYNVTPSSVEMTGTIRTFEPAVRARTLERFEKTVYSVAEGMGCRAEIDLRILAPALINRPEIAKRVQEIARGLFPEADVDSANYITMGAEDYAYYLEKAPGCYFFIGSANPKKGLNASHHNPLFDIDETALPYGAALMVATVIDFMKS